MKRDQKDNPKWSNYFEKNQTNLIVALVSTILNNLPYFVEIIRQKPHSVLEVGTGRGLHAILLSYFIPIVVGVDIDKKLIKKAKITNRYLKGRAHFLAMDAFNPVFLDQAFSVCCSQGFFEHFSNSDIQILTAKQLKVTKSIVFSVPSNFYPVRNIGDERLMPREEWEKILKSFSARVFYYGLVLDSSKGISGNLKLNSLKKIILSPRRGQICVVAME